MKQDVPMCIVCGTMRGPEAEQASCSKCAATIWPTIGSLRRAQTQNLPLICIDCFMKITDFEFGGFINHGESLPQDLSEKLFVKFESEMMKNRA